MHRSSAPCDLIVVSSTTEHASAAAHLMFRSVVRRRPMLLFDGHEHSLDGFTVHVLRLRRMFLLQNVSRARVLWLALKLTDATCLSGPK